MKRSSTLIFFGNERLSSGFCPNGAPTLQRIIASGYRVAAVVAHHTNATSRTARKLEIEEVAQAHRIPVLTPNRLLDIKDQLAAYRPDVGVLAAYGKIVPQSIIDLFRAGILNIHPSLLPLYRGPTPIETALLDGATATGVSIMQLVKEMDAGPLYAQKKVALKGDETKQALTETLLELGGNLLLDVLPKVLNDELAPSPQRGTPTYTSLIKKQDARIDWRTPAPQIERMIRAFAVWPQCQGMIVLPDARAVDIIPTKARVAQTTHALEAGRAAYINKQLLIGTSTTPMEILLLKLPGKKELTAEQFVHGYLRG